MPEINVIEDAVKEAIRLSSMAKEEKEIEGVYATNSDLSQLIKSLRAITKKPEKQSLLGLTRRVADITVLDSKLYYLVKQVVRVHGS